MKLAYIVTLLGADQKFIFETYKPPSLS